MGYMCTLNPKNKTLNGKNPGWVIGLDICMCYEETLQRDVLNETFGDKYKR